MTVSERIIANHLLGEVEKGLPDGPSASRSAFELLKKHVNAAGAALVAPAKVVKRRRRRRASADAAPQTTG